MRNTLIFVCGIVALVAVLFLWGCATTVYVPEGPPPPKAEMKPPAPGPHAVWIDGYWKWSHGRHVWVSGHWDKKPHGHWAPGHWDKRARGWVWIPGQWRR